MKVLMPLLLFAVVILSPTQAKDSDLMLKKSFRTSSGTTLNYLLFVPKNYTASQRYPLVVTLHGSGSDYIYQVDNNDQAHPWIEDSVQSRVPHFIMAPGCPGGTWGGMMGAGTELAQEAKAVIEAIENLKKQYTLDSNRFVICGFSLGGAGTYHQIQFMPNYWAAAVPSSAGGNADSIEVISKTPIWHHQGANDGGGGPLTRMADALEAHNYPTLRITSDLVITSPSSWNNEIKKGTDPKDLIFKNAKPSYDSINKAIESGARYLFLMINNGSHEDARINANHNPLVAKWAFMQSKGTTAITAVSLAPKAAATWTNRNRTVLTFGYPSNPGTDRIFSLLGRSCREYGAGEKFGTPAVRIYVPDVNRRQNRH